MTILTFLTSFWVPERLKSQETDQKRRPENDRKTDVDFIDFLVDFRTLSGAHNQRQVSFLGLLFGVFSVALF